MKKFSLSPRAFTLIELLIVITIIGILAAALLPRITSGPEKARDAQRKADLQQISTAMEFFADDNAGIYPDTVAGSCLPTGDLTDYLTSVPDDPQGLGDTCTTGYSYAQLNGGDSFILTAMLESDTANGEGHYNLADFTVTAPLTTQFSGQLTANTANLCSPFGANDCSADGVLYVVGR